MERLSFLFAVVLLFSNSVMAQQKEVSVYEVFRTHESIVIDGEMNENSWNRASVKSFEHLYGSQKPSDDQSSKFRMLWDEKSIYLFYEFEDKYLTARELNRDGAPYYDDCAEIFIIPVPDALDTHFGIEVNMYKASNDFIYFNNFYNNNSLGLKSFNPDFKVEVTYKGTINDNSDIDQGWTLEMEIPLSVFGFLGEVVPVQKGNLWTFLALRQDRNDMDGDRRSTSTLFPIADFSKNVHEPTDFGLMKFVD
ncbi:carbohydrate-binding family 9-like protein [Algibacter mikhailovii]|uniref:carbohydrate-binding family 9-like protein n=1 Tax=Algibacter mikhailovii TaxID=425498 RepID=UPI0024953FF6|nr:carbohydrate-binding family 9-like protein [Algibacter mikhailovii]